MGWLWGRTKTLGAVYGGGTFGSNVQAMVCVHDDVRAVLLDLREGAILSGFAPQRAATRSGAARASSHAPISPIEPIT